jgi:hypothetical protein
MQQMNNSLDNITRSNWYPYGSKKNQQSVIARSRVSRDRGTLIFIYNQKDEIATATPRARLRNDAVRRFLIDPERGKTDDTSPRYQRRNSGRRKQQRGGSVGHARVDPGYDEGEQPQA